MIAILKYNAGNIFSVNHAVLALGYKTVVTDNPDVLLKAEKVILPGVGEASSAMKYLSEHSLDVVIRSLTQPVLGICLGMQLLCSSSEEGNTFCLGKFDHKVKKFPPKDLVPHTGWNSVHNLKGELFRNINPGADFYFVHGYYAESGAQTIAETEYILPFTSAMQHDNFFGTQFHPEKSGKIGLFLLKNFLSL
ncbi:MAG: imidazole glycerol phosphate synthase subunit HisH [Saprospiraceae bacterium]|nr:imidazole glycerol phosphate synthase subunit HisH [Saprospiraceae bacterium]